ncbi:hypothetical protein GN956_G9775 [Arapaima gigas]
MRSSLLLFPLREDRCGGMWRDAERFRKSEERSLWRNALVWGHWHPDTPTMPPVPPCQLLEKTRPAQ